MPIPASVAKFYSTEQTSIEYHSPAEGVILHVVKYYYGVRHLSAVRLIFLMESLFLQNGYENDLSASYLKHLAQKSFMDMGSYVRTWSFHTGKDAAAFREIAGLVRSGVYTKNSLLTPIIYIFRHEKAESIHCGFLTAIDDEKNSLEFIELGSDGKKSKVIITESDFQEHREIKALYVDVPTKPILFSNVINYLLNHLSGDDFLKEKYIKDNNIIFDEHEEGPLSARAGAFNMIRKILESEEGLSDFLSPSVKESLLTYFQAREAV